MTVFNDIGPSPTTMNDESVRPIETRLPELVTIRPVGY